MRQVIFVHSAGPQGKGEGSSRFLEALRAELGDGFEFVAPLMPDPDSPDAGPWEAATGDLIRAARAPFALVGHSFGGSTILNTLAKQGVPKGLAGVVTVAAPFWAAPDWNVPEFALPPNAVETLAAVPQIVIFRGRDDADIAATHLDLYKQAIPSATTREIAGDHEFANGDIAAVAGAIRNLPGFLRAQARPSLHAAVAPPPASRG